MLRIARSISMLFGWMRDTGWATEKEALAKSRAH